jgi:hypothetical protein
VCVCVFVRVSGIDCPEHLIDTLKALKLKYPQFKLDRSDLNSLKHAVHTHSSNQHKGLDEFCLERRRLAIEEAADAEDSIPGFSAETKEFTLVQALKLLTDHGYKDLAFAHSGLRRLRKMDQSMDVERTKTLLDSTCGSSCVLFGSSA